MCRSEESRLETRLTAPYESRQFIIEQCGRLCMAELSDVATLLGSELVTNVVLHTRADPTIRVSSVRGQLLVEVTDDDPVLPSAPGDHTRERGEAPGGRGLTLVSRLADDWGVRPIPGDGKVVWFALRPVDPPEYSASCTCATQPSAVAPPS